MQASIRDGKDGRPGQEGVNAQDSQDDGWDQHGAQALLQMQPGKGETEEDGIKKQHEQDGEIPQYDHAVREMVEELNGPIGVGRKRPGQPAGQLSQRQVDQAEQ